MVNNSLQTKNFTSTSYDEYCGLQAQKSKNEANFLEQTILQYTQVTSQFGTPIPGLMYCKQTVVVSLSRSDVMNEDVMNGRT